MRYSSRNYIWKSTHLFRHSIFFGLVLVLTMACAKKEEGDRSKIRTTGGLRDATPAGPQTPGVQTQATQSNSLVWISEVRPESSGSGYRILSNVVSQTGKSDWIAIDINDELIKDVSFNFDGKRLQTQSQCITLDGIACGAYIISLLVYSNNSLLYQYALKVDLLEGRSQNYYIYNYPNSVMSIDQIRYQTMSN